MMLQVWRGRAFTSLPTNAQVNKWYESDVKDIKDGEAGKELFIHFQGWQPKWSW